MTKDTGIVNIHGKNYETVASRVQKFREQYKLEYAIVTEIVDRDEKMVVMKASILKGDQVIATGYAEESRTASTINRTSALENCETSAIGRALAAFGMAGSEYASAEEVAQAISQQRDFTLPPPAMTGPASDKQKQLIMEKLEAKGISKEEQRGYLIEQYGVDIPLTKEGASFVIEELIDDDKSSRGQVTKRDFVAA